MEINIKSIDPGRFIKSIISQLSFKEISLFRKSEDRVRTFCFLIIMLGAALRLALLVYAENKLDFDETTVGIMALNICEGRDFPIAFYGNTYNIGGAFESYVAAFLFVLFGISPLLVKASLILIWLPTAFFLFLLCRHVFSNAGTIFAVLFFCIPPLFFIDFSIQARGGFSETVFCSVFLLWLAVKLRKSEFGKSLSIILGISCGLAFFLSEMNAVMISCIFIWLLYSAHENRLRFIRYFLAGCACGLTPTVIYNLFIVAGSNIQQSAFASIINAFAQGNTSHLLNLNELISSFSFILHPAALGITAMLILSILAVCREKPSFLKEFGIVIIAYICIFTFAFCFHGHRYGMPIPTSRVLYSLYAPLACLFGYSACAFFNDRIWGKLVFSLVALACFIPIVLDIQTWLLSKRPLSCDSWYGKWRYVDGKLLHDLLVSGGVTDAFSSYHVGSPFIFAQRILISRDNASTKVKVHMDWNSALQIPPNAPIAIIGFPGSGQMKAIQAALDNKKIKYQYCFVENMMIIVGMQSSQLLEVEGLPGNLNEDVLPQPGENPGGFN